MNKPLKNWDPGKYADTGRFVADLAGPVLALLKAQPGERILDLGCGDGYLTKILAERGVNITGVDGSPDMVAAAQNLGVDARLMDGQALTFAAEFDAVFSNAALHWMRRPMDVITGVKRALKPGGRFVAECGGQGNIASVRVAVSAVLGDMGIENDVLTQNFYPSADGYRALLEQAGFTVDYIELIPRRTLVKNGIAAWLEAFRGDVFDRLPPDTARVAVDRIVALLAPVLCDEAGNAWLDYVRLRFKARLT